MVPGKCALLLLLLLSLLLLQELVTSSITSVAYPDSF
jgi:hypothetical protein